MARIGWINREGLPTRLTRWADLPADVLSDWPRVVAFGRRQVRVENHQGIEECQPRQVRVRTHVGVLEIRGRWLRLRLLDPQEVLVEGEIEQAAWYSEGGS